MSFFKKYGITIIIILTVILLVVIRSLGKDHFKPDTKKLYGPSVSRANLKTTDQVKSMTGEKLIINLQNSGSENPFSDSKSISVAPDSILAKAYLKLIKSNDGPVILVSADPSLSARIWMILSQMGFGNIFILDQGNTGETLKYKFRPDTMAEPELK